METWQDRYGYGMDFYEDEVVCNESCWNQNDRVFMYVNERFAWECESGGLHGANGVKVDIMENAYIFLLVILHRH